MGNSQGKNQGSVGHSKNDGIDVESPDVQRLKHCFQTIVSGGPRDAQHSSILLTEFKEKLFPISEDFGTLLGEHFLTDRAENTQGISCEQFVECGTKVLQLVSPTQQLEYYTAIFNKHKDVVSTEDCSRLLSICHSMAWECCAVSSEPLEADNTFIKAFQNSVFGVNDSTVLVDDFIRWCRTHCPNVFQALHSYTCSALCGENFTLNQHGASSNVPNVVKCLSEKKSLLTYPSIWFLSCTLPTMFIPEPAGDDSLTRRHIANLGNIISNDGWHLLYSSNDHGLSINRFQHHVFSYKGPTVVIIEFGDGHVFCLGVDQEWKDSTQKWGGSDCCLIQILPKYGSNLGGSNMVYYNIQDRSAPKGLYVGKDARTMVLNIDAEFNKVQHYGVEFTLHRVEVWGCGGAATRDAQTQQKQWERKQTEQHKDRKLKIDVEEWKESPDRQLLQMGGVKTEHAER